MSLKKLLWNDKATELFGHCRDQSERAAPERPEEDIASHRSHTARKVLKGSAAFTSALLFGTKESQGLIRTLGQASAEAGKNVWNSLPEDRTSTPMPDSLEEQDGYRYGHNGYGYYMGGFKVHD
ncbi:hypothetical protein [Halomonas huangheensis]|uniref:Uncharacterized protein n=1 Tax=Halomonas huangheensis TaxID=1178482 RepID=W1NAH8_9GAMM|nr:hypothetical protein [Halomonas huangheensis]ALM54082.1 hypothetical protein AR456_18725 [Halomonas huangheensis]ERL52529.1 hypothetical protein BJB45_08225 [Halomonas huangheensis]